MSLYRGIRKSLDRHSVFHGIYPGVNQPVSRVRVSAGDAEFDNRKKIAMIL